MKEVKLILESKQQALEILDKIQAKKTDEVLVEDTYYKQEPGKVKKLSKKEGNVFFAELKSNSSGGFDVIREDKVQDFDSMHTQFVEEHGIDIVVKRKTGYYSHNENNLYLIEIENVGTFLVVEGESVADNYVTSVLGLANPEYLRVPFSEIAKEKLGKIN